MKDLALEMTKRIAVATAMGVASHYLATKLIYGSFVAPHKIKKQR